MSPNTPLCAGKGCLNPARSIINGVGYCKFHFPKKKKKQAISTKVGRNEKCFCGSGLKSKNCCIK